MARIEPFCVLNTGLNSLMKKISKTKQWNFDLHFFKIENCLSFKADFVSPCSSKCLPITEHLCSLMRWCKCRAGYPTLNVVNHALIANNKGLLLFRSENLAKFQCNLCDSDYVRYTTRHLYRNGFKFFHIVAVFYS